ncbi:protein cramped isoform X1 [Cydia pomonella]|uniref:protein cramped isoform X1 n=1 Tax=Cydia pomonella TaxID=82600 RepID=UPI002ADDE3F7|nr:protein cramped isoform X1 [Cydia pomonella]
MSNKAQPSTMPNKAEPNRTQVAEVKVVPVVQNVTPSKTAPGAVAAKTSIAKATTKDSAMSPGAAPAAHSSSELLGSLTTQQQQRTSARVIKKLRTEPVPDPDKRDIPECDTPSKIDEKELKFPTVKQRMPKALWSADEKSLFFEALNEYGKDFDAITTHICAKMKKKGMPDVNLKTKTQVSHFYYRTWHKLSKHVHFGENVKKVAQELYALINYGELRKKLVSVSEKTCARLHEMVLSGSMVVRHRGRNVRVRTPMCRALRRLNQITERSLAVGVCALATVWLRARSASAWARVQAAAHNPRACVQLSPRTKLHALLRALDKRWQGKVKLHCKPKLENIVEMEPEEPEPPRPEENEDDLEDHLNLEPDRIIVQEQKLAKRPVLHVGPRPTATVRLPVVRASEQLSSQKICFSSYLQRMYSQDKEATKIRTPKRHRKDSSEKDKELEQKRPRLEDEPKLDIDETAVDGIELMANYKTNQEDEEKPSTEDEKEIKSEETAEEEGDKEGERDKYMSEREKDSFSEMEDDEKYIKSDSDNESDKDKGEKKTKFKNLKVKFRIRPKKRGGTIYTLVNEDEPKTEEPKEEEPPDIDVDSAVKQIRKGWSVYDAGDLTIGDLYLMFGARSKLDLDYWWAEPTPPLPKKELDKTPPQEKRPERTPDKGTDSSVEDERERRESDSDMFSPKASGQDSNDGSGDERKTEHLVSSPERKPSLSSLNLAGKLINRPAPAPPDDGFSQVSERLKRLLALAGNPHVGGALARCSCGHVCSQRKHQAKPPLAPARPEPLFRHPTPIAPKPASEPPLSMSLSDLPRWRRGRPRAADRRVVVQRLLPLLPKLPPPSNLIPVKIVPNSPPVPPRILPKPPPTSTNDLSLFYVLSESNGQFFFHDGDRRIPISAQDDNEESINTEEEIQDESYDSKEDTKEFKIDITATEVEKRVASKPDENEPTEPSAEPSQPSDSSQTSEKEKKAEGGDIANFLPSESMSLSPSRLLAGDGWLAGAHDFSLSSFLGQLEPAPSEQVSAVS